jgi:hypothetical protein
VANTFKVALQELLRQYQDDAQIDALREGVRLLALMELEVREQVGAERYERTPGRKTSRTGDRERAWDTRVGTIPLRIPKLRTGSYFPKPPPGPPPGRAGSGKRGPGRLWGRGEDAAGGRSSGPWGWRG